MAERSAAEVLDGAVAAVLARRRPVIAAASTAEAIELGELAGLARDLREIPTAEFRERLGAELAKITRDSKGGVMPAIEEARKAEAEPRAPAAAGAATPYLIVRGAAAAIDFYREAFGATEETRLAEPGGRIGHAAMRLGDATWMLADEYPELGILAPAAPGASGVSIRLPVPDVDAFVARAAAAGARVARPPRDEFYGERAGRLVDPFGHVWQVSTRREDVSLAEVRRRFDEMLAKGGEGGAPPRPSGPRPGFHAVTPYLQVRRPAELIGFVQEAFGAVESFRTTGPAGGMHAEVRIGDSMVMIGGMESLETESPAAIYLYVADVDRTYSRALAAGATSMLPPTDQPYGDRNAWVKDPFGNTWYIAAHAGGRP